MNTVISNKFPYLNNERLNMTRLHITPERKVTDIGVCTNLEEYIKITQSYSTK